MGGNLLSRVRYRGGNAYALFLKSLVSFFKFYFKSRFVILYSSSTVLDDGVHTDFVAPPPHMPQKIGNFSFQDLVSK